MKKSLLQNSVLPVLIVLVGAMSIGVITGCTSTDEETEESGGGGDNPYDPGPD